MTGTRAAVIYAAAACAIAGVGTLVMASKVAHMPLKPVFADHRPAPGDGAEVLVQPADDGASPSAPARTVAADVVAPPEISDRPLQRIAARPPLSELGTASQPRHAFSDEWRGTLLYRPVVTSSASFEAMGYAVTIADVDAIEPDTVCDYQGVAWPCGQRATLAFRYWLRGRALTCAMTMGSERHVVSVPCRLGKQDVGAWLVANGWAMARPDGVYVKAEDVARKSGMGIFGPPG